MTDRDLDLIMALAEGSLPPDEAAAAEAALDDASRAELAAQRQALMALSELSPAALTAAERSTLRAAIREELHVAPAPAARPLPAARPVPWYVRLLPALGATAAIVFVIGIGLNSLGGGDDADTGADDAGVAAEATEATSATTAAASELSGVEESAPALAESIEPTAATEASAQSDFARMMVPDNLGEVSLSDGDDIAAKVQRASEDLVEFFPYTVSELPAAASEPGLVCWGPLIEELRPGTLVDYMGEAIVDDQEAEVYRTVDDTGLVRIRIFDAVTCEPIADIIP